MAERVPQSERIYRFEDLKAWQEARTLTKMVYAATQSAAFERDRSLQGQIRRSAVSVMANVAEGHGRTGSKEFSHFLSICLGSLSELRSHLYICLDLNLIGNDQFHTITTKVSDVARLIGKLRSALEKRNGSMTKEESPEYCFEPDEERLTSYVLRPEEENKGIEAQGEQP